MVTLPGSDEIVSIGGLVPLHDALGTTLATVNSPGTIATQYTYDPFGNVTPSSSGYGTTFGMGGIELDPTGLYHAGVRFYHPTLQRFLSEDPAGYGGGDINLFAYSGAIRLTLAILRGWILVRLAIATAGVTVTHSTRFQVSSNSFFRRLILRRARRRLRSKRSGEVGHQ